MAELRRREDSAGRWNSWSLRKRGRSSKGGEGARELGWAVGSRQESSDGEGTVARGPRGVGGPRGGIRAGREGALGPTLAAAPRGRAADALSPCAVVIEDDRIDDVLKGMGEKPPSGV